jgi:beta-glucosidase-like glycosyl hydrolase/CubicO group peptidase (beta-lactamase class C family)
MFLNKIFLFFFSLPLLVVAQEDPVFYSAKAMKWADSVLAKMPIEDKLGQLFMVAAYSNKGADHKAAIATLIKEEHIGGLIFMQGGPVRQAKLTNYFQSISQIPLMIGMDAEWDLAMRLDSVFKFPWQMTMGAVSDQKLISDIGYQMGLHCKRLGVHISFSPVLDINTNPKNPIINARSFGQERVRVTANSLALMNGLQSVGVLACGKHFPGHGDTDADSHKALPVVAHDSLRLSEIELFPYQTLIDQGLASIMVAHLSVPALDTTGQAASLSAPIVTRLLKNTMGFKGLIITDALNMKGVSANYAPGDVDLEAFKAGNDILLFAENVPKAKARILEAIAKNEISEDDLNNRVRKILMAKYFVGLNKMPVIETKNLVADLNDRTSEMLNKQLMEKAITLLINKENLLPVESLSNKKIACVQMGSAPEPAFLAMLNNYTSVDGFVLGGNQNELLNTLSSYDLVIVGYHIDNKNPWKKYSPSDAQQLFLKKLALQNTFVLSLFANPYVLGMLPEAELADGLIMAYQNNIEANEAAAELVFGAIAAQGKLPVTASKLFDVGYGQQSKLLKRLSFGMPEEQGISLNALSGIEKYVNDAISAGATPGCQVLVAKNSQVIYNKSFGYHTYAKKIAVKNTDVYDIASITKIAATLPMIMKLVEEGKIDLDDELGAVYPPAKGTNKEHLRLRDMLAHQAGLQPWIPFYTKSMTNNLPDPKIYASTKSDTFNLEVAPHLYIKSSYVDEMYTEILASPLASKSYKYSDLGYYFFKAIAEANFRKPLDELTFETLYAPMGATTMGFNPLPYIKLDRIPPTEKDNYFRFETIQGTVHDQGAAMMGGIGGHAGLFTNALDLAKLMQMYLNNGEYGGTRFLDSTVLAEFTRCQFCENDNRRGAGFDKPTGMNVGPTCNCVSMLSFGHTGFTGTIAWVDPEQDIVFIFLSNRTWPDAENRKLIQMSTRTLIQEVIYNSLNTYNQ